MCNELFFDCINNNCGFNIIGWHKKVEISYVSNSEGDDNIESSNVTYHVTKFLPNNRNVLRYF